MMEEKEENDHDDLTEIEGSAEHPGEEENGSVKVNPTKIEVQEHDGYISLNHPQFYNTQQSQFFQSVYGSNSNGPVIHCGPYGNHVYGHFNHGPDQGYHDVHQHSYTNSFPYAPYDFHANSMMAVSNGQVAGQMKFKHPSNCYPIQNQIPNAQCLPVDCRYQFYPAVPAAGSGSAFPISTQNTTKRRRRRRRRRRGRGRRQRKSVPAPIEENSGFHKSFEENEIITLGFSEKIEKSDQPSLSGNTQNTASITDELTVESLCLE